MTSGFGVIGETLGDQGEKVRTDGYVSLCSASPTTAIGTSGSKLRSMELRHSHPLDTDTLAIRLCELSIIISSFRVTLLFWASMKWASMKRASHGLHAIQTNSDISICTAIRQAATSLNSLARFYPMSVVPWTDLSTRHLRGRDRGIETFRATVLFSMETRPAGNAS